MKKEKENVTYPPEFFVEGTRVRIIKKGLILYGKEFVYEKQDSHETAKISINGRYGYIDYKDIQPILPKLSFTPDMLKALLAGNKTQTTRKAITKTGKPAHRKKAGDVIGVGQRWGRDSRTGEAITEEKAKETGALEFVQFEPQGCTLPPQAVIHLLRIKTVELKRPCEFKLNEILAEGIYQTPEGWYRWGEESSPCLGARTAWEGLLKSIHKKPSDFETFWNNPQIVYVFELIR